MKIRFLSLANQEIDDAVRWYEEQVEGLSRDFLDELDRAVRLVRIYPLMARNRARDPALLIRSFPLFSNLWH
jgi:hypothetical protein